MSRESTGTVRLIGGKWYGKWSQEEEEGEDNMRTGCRLATARPQHSLD